MASCLLRAAGGSSTAAVPQRYRGGTAAPLSDVGSGRRVFSSTRHRNSSDSLTEETLRMSSEPSRHR